MGIEWGPIKKDFEKGAAPGELSVRYGCAPSTIRRKAKKEGWKAPREKAGGGENGPGKKEELADCHKELWKGIKRRLAKGLKNENPKKGLEDLKVAKIAGEVLSSVIKGERLAWGLDEAGFDEIEKVADQMEQATVPPGADEAVDRG